MKKIFIFTLLIALISLFLLSRVFIPRVSPQVFAGYCGDGTCGAGESCYNCPGDCPTCPTPSPTPTPPPDGGWVYCGTHQCPAYPATGQTVPYSCYPNCTSPQYCQNDEPCTGDVPPGTTCVYDSNCFPNNPYCPSGECPETHCVNEQCLSVCSPAHCEEPPDGPGGNSPPYIDAIYLSESSVCQATPGETVVLNAVYGDGNGVGDLKSAYIGLAPCGTSGDAYCTNFERNLANYFGGVFYTKDYVGSDQVRIAVENYGTTSCTGGASGNCSWGSLRPIGSMSVYNKPGTVEVTGVQVSRGVDKMTVSWTLKFHGIPANNYKIYAMVVDMSNVWQTGTGQPVRWWNNYSSLTVEACGISGRVYDSADTGTTCSSLTTKPPVGGAVVTGDLLADGAYTNTSLGNGSYALSNISEGTYVMSAAKDGYRFEGLVCDSNSPIGSFPIPPSKTNINIGISSRAGAWFQTKEGDVHSGGNIYSYVPDEVYATGGYFCLKGDGDTPGVVSYGNDYDFKQGSGKGEERVSSTGWLAKSNFPRKRYEYFYQLLGSPDENFFIDDLSVIGDEIVYYSVGAVDINGGSFPAGKKAVILVNSDVNINTNIDVPVGSFLAIIASGNINVANSVSQIEGVFITDLEFNSGTTVGTALTGEGMFIANSFSLGRDLEDLNETTAPEKFIYRPDFWLNAPSELLVPSYTWQEIAP